MLIAGLKADSHQTVCTVDSDVSILEPPFYQDGLHLLVTTYSGNNRTVVAIDIATCHILWKSEPFVGSKMSLKADKLKLGKKNLNFESACLPK